MWPEPSKLTGLSQHQLEIYSKVAGPFAIIGGSPGTGKSFLIGAIAEAIGDTFGLDNVLIGCPTGKAAVRVTENLQARSIDLRARTWHSLIMQLDSQKEEFFRAKVLIGDESSMLCCSLMASIFKRIPRGSLLLLCGDVNQLPPVGHGAPMRDLIAAGLPYGELTEIVRNSGGIVETCAAIRDQKAWAPADNLLLVDDPSTDKAASIRSIYQSAREEGLDLVNDVQVVCAVNEKSPLSRQNLNKMLQGMLNNQPGEVSKSGFRAGDKIVCVKNGFYKSLDSQLGGYFIEKKITPKLPADWDEFLNDYDATDPSDVEYFEQHQPYVEKRFIPDGSESPANDRDEVYVANGELGRVVDVDQKGMVIQLESPSRTIQVYFGAEGGCTFELGYALSVHKSQGSDWPWVVVMLDEYAGARMVCDRSWLYTAISRAKSKCWMVGKKQTAVRMCKTSKIWHRKTFLKERILMGMSRRILANA